MHWAHIIPFLVSSIAVGRDHFSLLLSSARPPGRGRQKKERQRRGRASCFGHQIIRREKKKTQEVALHQYLPPSLKKRAQCDGGNGIWQSIILGRERERMTGLENINGILQSSQARSIECSLVCLGSRLSGANDNKEEEGSQLEGVRCWLHVYRAKSRREGGQDEG